VVAADALDGDHAAGFARYYEGQMASLDRTL